MSDDSIEYLVCPRNAAPSSLILIVCLRAMLHNPDDYPDPGEFKPERFMGLDGDINKIAQDQLMTVVFGFGRR